MDEVLKQVSDVATQKPIEMDVDIQPVNIVHRYLQRWKVMPTKRTFTIRPITYGNLIRISNLLLSIDMKVFDMKNLLDSNYNAITKHAESVAKVVAIAIHNNRDEPPASVTRFVLFNFTSQEMMSTLNIVLQQMNVTGFMYSIISIRGLNVLESGTANASSVSEVSPLTAGEIIAPGI
jgi:hypothetical protein